jgi:hypothetical protein
MGDGWVMVLAVNLSARSSDVTRLTTLSVSTPVHAKSTPIVLEAEVISEQ